MSAALIPLQEAVVIRGQRAWSFIKKSAADQRQAWREVGEALAYGRALHPSNQAFGKWCMATGFDMDFRVRNDAMWFAGAVLQTLDNDLTHPTAIRQYAKNLDADTPPTPELTLTAPSKLTASIEQVAPQATWLPDFKTIWISD